MQSHAVGGGGQNNKNCLSSGGSEGGGGKHKLWRKDRENKIVEEEA